MEDENIFYGAKSEWKIRIFRSVVKVLQICYFTVVARGLLCVKIALQACSFTTKLLEIQEMKNR